MKPTPTNQLLFNTLALTQTSASGIDHAFLKAVWAKEITYQIPDVLELRGGLKYPTQVQCLAIGQSLYSAPSLLAISSLLTKEQAAQLNSISLHIRSKIAASFKAVPIEKRMIDNLNTYRRNI